MVGQLLGRSANFGGRAPEGLDPDKGRRVAYAARVSAFGTALVVSVACYAQAAFVFAWLWLYGPRHDAVGLAFSGMAAGATGAALGAVFLTAEVAPETAELGARLLYAGSFVAGIGLFRVAAELSGRPVPRAVSRAVVATLVASAVIAALGLVHDPRTVEPEMAHAPSLRPLGAVLLAFALATFVLDVALLARAARERASARWILVGITPAAIATGYEQIARLWGRTPIFSLVLLGTLVIVTASWVLLRRFAAVGDRLRARKLALEASHAALVRATQDRSSAKHLADVGELSVVLASEFEAPMSALRRSVESLTLEALERGEANRTLDAIDAETSYLNRLVGDLLLFAKPLRHERRDVRVAALVEDALVETRAHHGSTLSVDLDVEPGLVVRCEPDAMRHAIVKVLENAVEAAAGSTIQIRARADEVRRVRLEIIDPGDGMDTLVRSRALEPFFTTHKQGTGLGLAIVARVVGAHEGRVSIDSSRGRGTTVTLLLPPRAAAG